MNTSVRSLMPALGLCVGLMLAPGTVSAQSLEPPLATLWGQARGFSLGLRYQVDGLTVDDSGDPSQVRIEPMGAGLSVLAGYSFTPHFHTRLTIGSSQHSTSLADLDVVRSAASLEAHYRFRPDQQVCPYLMGALGGTDVRADRGADHVRISGGTAGVGGGLLVGLARHVMMDMGLRLEAVNWDTIEWSQAQPGGGTLEYSDRVEDSGGSSRLEVGFVWQF